MDQTPAAVAVKQLAEPLERTPLSWRTGSTGEVHAEFAWLRVWPAHRWQHGRAADAVPDRETEARWLLVEWRSDGSIRYALSNVPPETTMLEAVGLWKSRWQVEQGSQQLKEELGLDHFEGRTWPGFHHHATMCFLAYGFLALERRRGTPSVLDDLEEQLPTSPFRAEVRIPTDRSLDRRCRRSAVACNVGWPTLAHLTAHGARSTTPTPPASHNNPTP